MKKKLVVLTGAGISAESGIKTFRDSNGLWENHDVMEVASPEGWAKNPGLVLEFYNQRRKNGMEAQPNRGHIVLAELEQYFDVQIITQNVDTLHEKAGSTSVMHIHGRLDRARSTKNPKLTYPIKGDRLDLGDTCELGSQLRPDIVWFGEAVPLISHAEALAREADIFLVVGTSFVVYPAAGLIDRVPAAVPKFVVDPNPAYLGPRYPGLTVIAEIGSTGMEKVKAILLEKYVS